MTRAEATACVLYNDGRFLESEVKLPYQGKGITWGFTVGPVRTSSVLRISDSGDWTELTELAVGAQAPKRYMELRVSPQR